MGGNSGVEAGARLRLPGPKTLFCEAFEMLGFLLVIGIRSAMAEN
jgi:hypothetical protein